MCVWACMCVCECVCAKHSTPLISQDAELYMPTHTHTHTHTHTTTQGVPRAGCTNEAACKQLPSLHSILWTVSAITLQLPTVRAHTCIHTHTRCTNIYTNTHAQSVGSSSFLSRLMLTEADARRTSCSFFFCGGGGCLAQVQLFKTETPSLNLSQAHHHHISSTASVTSLSLSLGLSVCWSRRKPGGEGGGGGGGGGSA